MDDPGDYLRTVVRVFPDYADTVLWFASGPVDYEDAGVSDDLGHAMMSWERAWYDGVTDDLHFSSVEIARELGTEGLRLATWLSAELGDSFEVEVLLEETGVGNQRLSGTGPGSNPNAVAAFRRMAAEDKAEQDWIQARIAEGATFTLVAGAPEG
ncbi:MAG TPA: hypothetical protein VGM94_09935 [Galbitalea sp.]|jgi:hypothetical protein